MDKQDRKKLFGLILKNSREKLGFTQDKFSSLIELDTTNLSRIENGKSSPSFDTLCNMIEVLNIDPNYLLYFLKFAEKRHSYEDIETFENLERIKTDVKKGITDLIKLLAK